MSIYKKILGNDFYHLHPMLQKRYEFKDSYQFKGKGVMRYITNKSKWLFPLFLFSQKYKLFFPETGKSVPFKIINTQTIGNNGMEQVHWERVFYFNDKKRYFNASMYLDLEQKLIQDYLGEPSKCYSDLLLSVTKDRGLRINSKEQRLIFPFLEIPLPKIVQGLATVTEKYLETKAVYYIQVNVTNPLIGTIFSYEGEFVEDDVS
ncbi:DUF4166 domain-containing protein [Virgibacillus salexigens]|uniref:DUF4166 domain-containing protein n=1 Tax=Virgibacillus kapii TaxID=1638645 RepID=A0ABQ2D1W0_9BACI|nr:DUF4166 domain-containing protein [Virgibacillus kapii]GGJ42302.1 hypothetical protein GCM10007111_00590 [Virgibacillus kapii]